MKKFTKIILGCMIAFASYMFFTAQAEAVNKNNFISKVHPITNNMNSILVDTTSKYYDIDSLTVKVGTKTYTFDYFDLWITSNEKKQEIEFNQKFTAGQTVKIYANYTTYDDDYNDIQNTVLIDTLKVSDKTPPKTTISNVTVRTTSATVTTESGAKLAATYNGKKVSLKKKSATKYTIALPKPIKGKKLIVKATDKVGNSKAYTKTTTVPSTIKMTGSNTLVSKKKLTGKVSGAKATDYVYFKANSKTYKSKIKSGKYTINFPANLSTPRAVTMYVKDKYNNTLTKKSVRIYKYANFKIGMTTSQAANTVYGKSSDIDRSVYSSFTSEYWMYYTGNKTMMISFYNGKIDAISKW
ncbi:MAG: hypothetical protein KBT36_12245 [Kurthia sp.]|nr:hypothetical protein [Candidatus Kurthia equi]